MNWEINKQVYDKKTIKKDIKIKFQMILKNLDDENIEIFLLNLKDVINFINNFNKIINIGYEYCKWIEKVNNYIYLQIKKKKYTFSQSVLFNIIKIIKKFKFLKDKENLIILTLNNLSILYKKLNDFKNALKVLKNAVKIIKSNENVSNADVSYINLVNLFYLLKDKRKEVESLKRAFYYCQKELNFLTNILANDYKYLSKNQIKKLKIKIDKKREYLSFCYYYKGRIYHQSYNFEKAFIYYNEGLELMKDRKFENKKIIEKLTKAIIDCNQTMYNFNLLKNNKKVNCIYHKKKNSKNFSISKYNETDLFETNRDMLKSIYCGNSVNKVYGQNNIVKNNKLKAKQGFFVKKRNKNKSKESSKSNIKDDKISKDSSKSKSNIKSVKISNKSSTSSLKSNKTSQDKSIKSYKISNLSNTITNNQSKEEFIANTKPILNNYNLQNLKDTKSKKFVIKKRKFTTSNSSVNNTYENNNIEFEEKETNLQRIQKLEEKNKLFIKKDDRLKFLNQLFTNNLEKSEKITKENFIEESSKSFMEDENIVIGIENADNKHNEINFNKIKKFLNKKVKIKKNFVKKNLKIFSGIKKIKCNSVNGLVKFFYFKVIINYFEENMVLEILLNNWDIENNLIKHSIEFKEYLINKDEIITRPEATDISHNILSLIVIENNKLIILCNLLSIINPFYCFFQKREQELIKKKKDNVEDQLYENEKKKLIKWIHNVLNLNKFALIIQKNWKKFVNLSKIKFNKNKKFQIIYSLAIKYENHYVKIIISKILKNELNIDNYSVLNNDFKSFNKNFNNYILINAFDYHLNRGFKGLLIPNKFLKISDLKYPYIFDILNLDRKKMEINITEYYLHKLNLVELCKKLYINDDKLKLITKIQTNIRMYLNKKILLSKFLIKEGANKKKSKLKLVGKYIKSLECIKDSKIINSKKYFFITIKKPILENCLLLSLKELEFPRKLIFNKNFFFNFFNNTNIDENKILKKISIHIKNNIYINNDCIALKPFDNLFNFKFKVIEEDVNKNNNKNINFLKKYYKNNYEKNYLKYYFNEKIKNNNNQNLIEKINIGGLKDDITKNDINYLDKSNKTKNLVKSVKTYYRFKKINEAIHFMINKKNELDNLKEQKILNESVQFNHITIKTIKLRYNETISAIGSNKLILDDVELKYDYNNLILYYNDELYVITPNSMGYTYFNLNKDLNKIIKKIENTYVIKNEKIKLFKRKETNYINKTSNKSTEALKKIFNFLRNKYFRFINTIKLKLLKISKNSENKYLVSKLVNLNNDIYFISIYFNINEYCFLIKSNEFPNYNKKIEKNLSFKNFKNIFKNSSNSVINNEHNSSFIYNIFQNEIKILSSALYIDNEKNKKNIIFNRPINELSIEEMNKYLTSSYKINKPKAIDSSKFSNKLNSIMTIQRFYRNKINKNNFELMWKSYRKPFKIVNSFVLSINNNSENKNSTYSVVTLIYNNYLKNISFILFIYNKRFKSIYKGEVYYYFLLQEYYPDNWKNIEKNEVHFVKYILPKLTNRLKNDIKLINYNNNYKLTVFNNIEIDLKEIKVRKIKQVLNKKRLMNYDNFINILINIINNRKKKILFEFELYSSSLVKNKENIELKSKFTKKFGENYYEIKIYEKSDILRNLIFKIRNLNINEKNTKSDKIYKVLHQNLLTIYNIVNINNYYKLIIDHLRFKNDEFFIEQPKIYYISIILRNNEDFKEITFCKFSENIKKIKLNKIDWKKDFENINFNNKNLKNTENIFISLNFEKISEYVKVENLELKENFDNIMENIIKSFVIINDNIFLNRINFDYTIISDISTGFESIFDYNLGLKNNYNDYYSDPYKIKKLIIKKSLISNNLNYNIKLAKIEYFSKNLENNNKIEFEVDVKCIENDNKNNYFKLSLKECTYLLSLDNHDLIADYIINEILIRKNEISNEIILPIEHYITQEEFNNFKNNKKIILIPNIIIRNLINIKFNNNYFYYKKYLKKLQKNNYHGPILIKDELYIYFILYFYEDNLNNINISTFILNDYKKQEFLITSNELKNYLLLKNTINEILPSIFKLENNTIIMNKTELFYRLNVILNN